MLVASLQEPAAGVLHQQSMAIVDRIAQLERKHCIWEMKAEHQDQRHAVPSRTEKRCCVYCSVHVVYPLAFSSIFLFKLKFFSTMLCWFLPNNNKIGHNYTFVPSTTPHPIPPGPQSARLASLSYTITSHQIAILQPIVYICDATFSIHPTFSFLYRVHKFILYIHISIHSFPANRFIDTIFLDSIYMH